TFPTRRSSDLPRGHHADDREPMAVQSHFPPDNVAGAAETVPPQTMADDGDRMRVRRSVVFGRDHATERGARAERLEVIARDDHAFDQIGRFRLFIAVQTYGDAAISRQPAEDFVPVSVINIVEIRDRRPWAVARAVKDEHQLARLRHGQLPEAEGVDDAEHRSISADAKRE